MSPESKKQNLKDRALLLGKVRSFFASKEVLEVDTPILSHSAPIDEHIDVIEANLGGIKGYLHTSPEYAMKRLLSTGIGDIYQLGHVFRLGEFGTLHNPEFTMIEWYRTQIDLPLFIQETIELIQIFLGPTPSRQIAYRDALKLYAEIDYVQASKEDLLKCCARHGIELSFEESWSKDSLLHLLMGSVVEPHLGKEEILVLSDYPAFQAALAKTEIKQGEVVAKRFEIYHRGVELANGYLELTDASEQRKRFVESNEKRVEAGKPPLPIDEHFLTALEKGLPECCGVAVGFDRLMMLRHHACSIEEVLPFAWNDV